VLKFKTSSRRLFFWMQEAETDKDEEFQRKVNDYLNNPPAPGTHSGGSTPGSGLGLPSDLSGDGDLQSLLNNMSQQQLMQIFGGVGGLGNLNALLSGRPSTNSSSNATRGTESFPSAQTATVTTTPQTQPSEATTTTTTTTAAVTPAATATTNSTTPAVQLSDLQSILANMSVPPPEERENQAIDLSSSFTVDALQPILNNPEFLERLKAYLPAMHEGDQNSVADGAGTDDVRSTVQSPQFQQAMSMFSAAFTSGQLGPLMQQFGLSEQAIEAANRGDLEAFVRAMQAAQNSRSSQNNTDSDKMDLD